MSSINLKFFSLAIRIAFVVSKMTKNELDSIKVLSFSPIIDQASQNEEFKSTKTKLELPSDNETKNNSDQIKQINSISYIQIGIYIYL